MPPPNDDRTPEQCYLVLRRIGVVAQFVAPAEDQAYAKAVRTLGKADGFVVETRIMVKPKLRPAHKRTGRKWERLFTLTDGKGNVRMPDSPEWSEQ